MRKLNIVVCMLSLLTLTYIYFSNTQKISYDFYDKGNKKINNAIDSLGVPCGDLFLKITDGLKNDETWVQLRIISSLTDDFARSVVQSSNRYYQFKTCDIPVVSRYDGKYAIDRKAGRLPNGFWERPALRAFHSVYVEINE